MVEMKSNITIGDYEFNNCHSFKTKKGWKQLTQTAVIKMHNIAGLLGAIKVGDEVVISGAYDDNDLIEEFMGYVSKIKPTYPVEIHCEDEMWKRKQETVEGSWKLITLENLLKTVFPDAVIDCPVVNLSNFRIEKGSTKAFVLQKLKDEYLLTSYYRGKTLFVGLPYTEKNMPEVVFNFQKNALADTLEYVRKEDLRQKVRAISVLPNNTKIEKEVGDSDGNSITLHFYNKTEQELVALANEQINRLKYDGYKGTFRSLGAYPYVDHGNTLWLEDDLYPEREIAVFADYVETDYGPEGYHRTITPGRKILI
jgi:hypothetical protein